MGLVVAPSRLPAGRQLPHNLHPCAVVPGCRLFVYVVMAVLAGAMALIWRV